MDQDIFYRGGQGKESQLSSKEYCSKAYILRHTVFIRLTALGAKFLNLESGRLFEAGRLFE